MPANIARKADGSAMFVNALIRPGDRSAWWDGDGKYNVRGAMTPKVALERSGLGYRVDRAPVYVRVGGKYVADETHVALIRKDTHGVMGIVTPDYREVQNAVAVDIAYAIVGEAKGRKAKAAVATMGALGNGSRCFFTLDLTALGQLRVDRDPSRHETYLIGQWGHDGTSALRYSLWDNRVVCQNTSAAADAYGTREGVLARLTHVGDMAEKVKEAQRILGFAEKAIRRHYEVMNALAAVALPRNGALDKFLTAFGEELIPIPPEMERTAGREAARDAVKGIILHSPTLEGVPMNAYRVYSGVTEYADHYRPLRVADPNLVAERRVTQAIGAAGDLKAAALDILTRKFEIAVPVPVLARSN
jgi:phage/plasmid-like protein (TIGR03299 family)